MGEGKILQFNSKLNTKTKTSPKTLEELMYRIKTCSQPRELIGLIGTIDTDSAVVISKLFDMAFESGLKRD